MKIAEEHTEDDTTRAQEHEAAIFKLTEEHPKDGLSRAQEHEAAIFGMAKEAAAGAQED